MLYVKTQLNDQIEIKIDLYEDEIFTRCGDCEKEMQVEPNEIVQILTECCDFAGTTFICPECTEKRYSKLKG